MNHVWVRGGVELLGIEEGTKEMNQNRVGVFGVSIEKKKEIILKSFELIQFPGRTPHLIFVSFLGTFKRKLYPWYLVIV